MRLKGVQIEEERLQEIERRNHILLNRISFQMLNPSEVSSLHIHSEEETLALIIDAVDHKRKRDKEKITKENMTILQRIEDKAPNYNRLAWFNERRKNLEYLANISSYPMHYMEDLDEYEEQFPYRGRTPGGTHHPIRAQTHDPKENTDLDTKQTMRPSTEPMRMPKKQENLKKMASANAEEPLVSIPRSHSAGTHKTKQPVRPKPEVTEKVEESGQIPEEIVAGRESVAVDRRPTIPAKDIPEAIDSNIVSGSGSKEELQDAEPVEEEVVAEAKETTQSPTLVSKVASKAGSKVNLKDSAPASKKGSRADLHHNGSAAKLNDSSSVPASNKASASNLRKEVLASSQKASAAKLASTVPASKQASVSNLLDAKQSSKTASAVVSKAASAAKLNDDSSQSKSVKGSAKSLSKTASSKSPLAAPLRASNKSLTKSSSEPLVMSKSLANSKEKLKDSPKSVKGSKSSLNKAASESVVIGKGGSLVASKSKLIESFTAGEAKSQKGSADNVVSNEPEIENEVVSSGEPNTEDEQKATEDPPATEEIDPTADPDLEY
ncbi:hypothetical protein HDU79_007153 [Rhizoclosmatium sp. JEL0117]|nr:hypothetical protein HDU79_007153 [Rhizoclosmatium sp. JEL0117]